MAKRIGTASVLTVNSGSSANLVAFSALTSPKLRERQLKPGDEVITVAAGFPDHRQPDPAVRRGAGVRRRRHPDLQHRRRPGRSARSPQRTRAIMVAHTLGNPFDLDAVTRRSPRSTTCCSSRTAATRWAPPTTAAMSAPSATSARCSFYPAHHITMGEGGAVLHATTPTLKTLVESFRDWGRDCWCAPGKDNTCGKRFGWQLGDLPLRLRPQVHLLAHRLQPEDHRHAGGRRRGAARSAWTASSPRAARNFALPQEAPARPARSSSSCPRRRRGSEPSWFGFPITVREGAPFSRDELVALPRTPTRSARACCSAAT